MNACRKSFLSKTAWKFVAIGGIFLLSASIQAGTWVKRSSNNGTCTTNYIPVSTKYLPDGTLVPGFCVMKYEARKPSALLGNRAVLNGNLVSASIAYPVPSPTELPWVSLTWQDAKAACTSIGASLITDNQWVSIAHQVAGVASNWTGGAVGNGSLFTGHTDNTPSNALAIGGSLTIAIDSDGYSGTGNTSASGASQRRTLTLPSGQIIWDFSGNVAEWVDNSFFSVNRYHAGSSGWMAYNSADGVAAVATQVPQSKLPPSGYSANQGMGRYLDGTTVTGTINNINESPDFSTGPSSSAVFIRGGAWDYGSNGGVFALSLNNGKSFALGSIGFRCVK